MVTEMNMTIHEGTLYLPEKQVVSAEVVTVAGLVGGVLLYVGDGYVPALCVEDRTKADALFVEGDRHSWYARFYWVQVQDEEYGSYEDVCSFADLQPGDRRRVLAPGSLRFGCEVLRVAGCVPEQMGVMG